MHLVPPALLNWMLGCQPGCLQRRAPPGMRQNLGPPATWQPTRCLQGSREGPGIRLGLMLRPGIRALPARRMLPGGASPSAASAPAAAGASGTASPAVPCSVAERAALLQRSAAASRRRRCGRLPGRHERLLQVRYSSRERPQRLYAAAGDQPGDLGVSDDRQRNARDGCKAVSVVQTR